MLRGSLADTINFNRVTAEPGDVLRDLRWFEITRGWS
jgi:hypothetical protein